MFSPYNNNMATSVAFCSLVGLGNARISFNNNRMIISTEKRPIKMWLTNIEDGALQQAKNLANLPFTFKHIAIMPDSHQGYGMPIGGVLAAKGVIIPNAVGVDIGCGMCAVKTSLVDISQKQIKKIFGEIRKVIPLGMNKHKEFQFGAPEEVGVLKIVEHNWGNAKQSIGTLGGGNHFIEIQKGDDGHVWIMVHSGSRNLGLQVATYYNKLAIELNKKWYSSVDPKWELAFLPLDSEEGKSYIAEMNYCVEYALANRKIMMDRILEIFAKEFGAEDLSEPMINIAHNYARMENHFGENVMIHRKGATLATKDTIGIIPGSQGTKSYIVRGKGNPESFNSCSHGAGRKMSRTKAIADLDLDNEVKKLDDQGIVHGIRNKKDLDEAPGSYKDIENVMENQSDLVEILVKLTPLGVIKA